MFFICLRLLLRRVNPAVGYEIVVDYGVEQEGVYAVVEVTVHVIIGPVDVSFVFPPHDFLERATIAFDIPDGMDSLLVCEASWKICLPLWFLSYAQV